MIRAPDNEKKSKHNRNGNIKVINKTKNMWNACPKQTKSKCSCKSRTWISADVFYGDQCHCCILFVDTDEGRLSSFCLSASYWIHILAAKHRVSRYRGIKFNQRTSKLLSTLLEAKDRSRVSSSETCGNRYAISATKGRQWGFERKFTQAGAGPLDGQGMMSATDTHVTFMQTQV